jgi:hypothetical protein
MSNTGIQLARSIAAMSRMSRCVFLSSLAVLSTAGAQAQSDGRAESVGAQPWSFSITPYLWAAGIDGDTAANGIGSEIDTGYSFLSLDNLDLAIATAAQARKGKWSVLLDGMYVDFSDTFDRTLVSTEAEVSGGYFEASAAYPAARIPGLDLIFGLRYVGLETSVQLTPGPSAERRESWLDPLVGARFSHEFNDRWSVTLRGDIGGFGVSSELTTNVAAIFGVRLTDAMTLRFGYRALQMDFEDDQFVLDATLQGYVVGLTFAL